MLMKWINNDALFQGFKATMIHKSCLEKRSSLITNWIRNSSSPLTVEGVEHFLLSHEADEENHTLLYHLPKCDLHEELDKVNYYS